jgi:hypothetical protein
MPSASSETIASSIAKARKVAIPTLDSRWRLQPQSTTTCRTRYEYLVLTERDKKLFQTVYESQNPNFERELLHHIQKAMDWCS